MTWADQTFGYKKMITIDKTKVGADATDFPILLSFTDASLAGTGSGGHVQHASGWDVVFYDSTEATLLKHEICLYVTGTGQLIFWVRVPSLSSTTNTVIYVYYGKSGIGADPSSTTTWSSYTHVWHLDEAAGNVLDSAASGNTGTKYGAPTYGGAGQINKNIQYAGAADYFQFATKLSGTAGTITAWFKYSDVTNNGVVLSAGVLASDTRYEMYNVEYLVSHPRIACYCRYYGSGAANHVYGNTNLDDGNWHYLAWVSNDTSWTLYNNGVAETLTVVGGTNNGEWMNDYASYTTWCNGVLKRPSMTYYLKAYLEELRYTQTTARTATWLLTEYNNQYNPSTFLSVGGEYAFYTVIVTEILGIKDTVIATIPKQTSVSEKIGVKETVIAMKFHVPQVYLATVPEKIGLQETIATATKFQPVINELIGELDTVSYVWHATATDNETIGIKDTPVTYMKYQPVINEKIGELDTVQTTLAAGKLATANEFLGLKETTAVNAWFKPVINEKIGIKDTLLEWATFSRTINETLGIMETATTLRARLSATTELFGLINTVVATLAAGKSTTVNEILGLLDTKTVNAKFQPVINEFIGIKDTPVFSTAWSRTITQRIGIVENVQTVKYSVNQFLVTVNEVIWLKDTIATTNAFTRNVPETIGLMDTPVNYAKYSKTVSELLGIKETIATNAWFKPIITELLGVKETATGTLYSGKLSIVNEILGIKDTTSTFATLQALANEKIGLLDTLTLSAKYARTVNEMVGLLDRYNFRFSINTFEKIGLLDSASTIKNYVFVSFGYGYDVNVYY